MPAEHLGDIQGESDSDLAAALRDCLRFGALVIDVGQGTATLAGQAARILGLEPVAGPCYPLAALPASIRQVLGEIGSARSPPARRQIEMERLGAGAVKVRLEVLQFEPGAPSGPVVVLINEAGPAAELERKLCQFERLANLGTLSASVAHEIRNALVAVRTFTDLLIEKDPETEMALLVRREIQRIDSIVGRMLRFSARPARLPPR